METGIACNFHEQQQQRRAQAIPLLICVCVHALERWAQVAAAADDCDCGSKRACERVPGSGWTLLPAPLPPLNGRRTDARRSGNEKNRREKERQRTENAMLPASLYLLLISHSLPSPLSLTRPAPLSACFILGNRKFRSHTRNLQLHRRVSAGIAPRM